jgi:5'-3' exonuclease
LYDRHYVSPLLAKHHQHDLRGEQRESRRDRDKDQRHQAERLDQAVTNAEIVLAELDERGQEHTAANVARCANGGVG